MHGPTKEGLNAPTKHLAELGTLIHPIEPIAHCGMPVHYVLPTFEKKVRYMLSTYKCAASAHAVRYMLSTFEKKARPVRVPTLADARDVGRWEIVPEPYGVVLIIAPWNYPFGLVMNPLIGAIAAGNVAVIKPSEISANTTALIADLIPKYLDARVVRVVLGAVPETTALLEQRFDMICYTGGTRVGRIVAAAAARHLTPALLELGGKCPVYVHKSAHLPAAARRILEGRLRNCGQMCTAADYVLVDREVAPKLVDEMKDKLAKHWADPQAHSQYCRLVSEAGVDQEDHGGKVVAGGKIDRGDRYMEPTIVLAPKPESRLMTEEIFGPILPVVPIDGGIDEAIERVNAKGTPLAAYAFMDDKQLAERWVERVSAGGMAINHVAAHVNNINVPFGGKGESGMGSNRGAYSFDAFSHHKTVLLADTGKGGLIANALSAVKNILHTRAA
ncbi:Aldehyde/histidinol dehydrogenase [Tribonema minus]|uniref:Aldehyde dehydrogenase n=1 Tax=Tribonema minus TaxID=303371 RepID=A0A835ZQA2_9STRA|nr:Aldehyde/histidinol dehydrogenase [Tribonema minus]